MANADLLTTGDRLRIFNVVVSAAIAPYVLSGRDVSVDLDALGRDHPRALADIVAIVDARRAALNSHALGR